MGKLRFFGNPYDWKESIIWIGKHVLLEVEIPLMILFIIMIFSPMNIIPKGILLLLLIISLVFLVPYIYFFIQRQLPENKVKISEGTEVEDVKSQDEFKIKWREIEFKSVDIKKSYNIGFVGDIMKMRNYTLNIDDSIKEFFNDTHLIVGNLEGIITQSRWQGLSAQKHSDIILNKIIDQFSPHKKKTEIRNTQTDIMKGLKKPKKWLLCLSNNHGADYGRDEFQKCKKIIIKMQKEGFNVFGDMKNQSFSCGHYKEISIVCGTMWNNQRNHCYVAQFDFINDNIECKKKFKILYPHWHYENEHYVRKSIQIKSKNLIKKGEYVSNYKCKRLTQKKYKFNPDKWDLIVGHHSHLPQPFEVIISEEKKIPMILAYSCGNFTSSQGRKKHISGLIFTAYIGKDEISGQYAVSKLKWAYTHNVRNKKDEIVTVKIDKPSTKANIYLKPPKRWLMTIFISAFFFLFWILLVWGISENNLLYLIIFSWNMFAFLIIYIILKLWRNTKKIVKNVPITE